MMIGFNRLLIQLTENMEIDIMEVHRKIKNLTIILNQRSKLKFCCCFFFKLILIVPSVFQETVKRKKIEAGVELEVEIVNVLKKEVDLEIVKEVVEIVDIVDRDRAKDVIEIENVRKQKKRLQN